MQSVSPRSSRQTGIGKWLLTVSVLANFFLLGLFVAPLLRPQPHLPPPEPGALLNHMADLLPPQDAPAFRAAYAKAQPDIVAGHEAMDAGMHQVAAALEQPAVDDGDLQKALSDIGAAHEKIGQAMAGLIKQVATLSPEGRRVFAENGLHPPGGRHRPDMPVPEGDRPPPDGDMHPPGP